MNVLIIGTGDIAYSHGKAIQRLGGSVIAAYDVNKEKLNAFSDYFHCTGIEYTQLDEFIEKSDYVVLATPPSKRIEYIEKVLRAHVALYMEKPVAATLEDAEYIRQMCEKYNGYIIVGFAHRYRPAFVKLYDLVSSGLLGEPVSLFSYRIGPGPGFSNSNLPQNTWRTDPNLVCGMTVESLSHEFNLLTTLAGEIDTISANVFAANPNLPSFDNNASITMRMNCGCIATILSSWSSDLGSSSRGYIGTNGTAIIEGENMFEFTTLRYKTRDMEKEEVLSFDDSYDYGKDDVIFHVHEHFWDCLKNGKTIITPYSEGLKVLKLSRLALESSETKTALKV